MKYLLIILSMTLLAGCGTYDRFTGAAEPVEFAMCSKSKGGGVIGAVSGNTDIIKITTQGTISKSLADGKITIQCSDDAKSISVAPAE